MLPAPNKPLCFVLMPFGIRKDPGNGLDIDFDAIYDLGIRPGIEAAGMEPIRADEERTGVIIHKPMFERLMLCDFAVADLTTANANVFYELGVRHALRPSTTLTIFASNQSIPFDLNYLRSLPYSLGENSQFGPAQARELKQNIRQRLSDLKDLQTRGEVKDSPIFQLLQDYGQPDIARLKTDVFREQAEYSASQKHALAYARETGQVTAVHEIEDSLGGDFQAIEAGVLVDLFLSYRAVQGWQSMVELYERLPTALKRAVMMREQLGFALNRLGRRSEALTVLEEVVREYGRSSESCGLIGRIHKDQWGEAKKQGDVYLAASHLEKAINAYLEGFESDIRDAYPGINAVTLLEIKGDPAALATQAELLPLVRFAVRHRLKTTSPDYWDQASQLELAVLANAEGEALHYLGDALASVREPWEPLTTANNLKSIREARLERSIAQGWLDEIIGQLELRGGID